MPDIETGKLGEDFVAETLKNKGYRIVERNYHSRFGEIDIIAADDKYIIFVEVKTRKTIGITNPLEAVTVAKQRRIICTAKYFLMNHPYKLQPRFDVAAVETENKIIVSLNYLTDAFRLN